MAEPISQASLQTTLTSSLDATHVEIVDTSGGCGQSFSALIVSPRFASLSSLKRHRLVNGALKEEIGRIHAWSAICRTPEEFDVEKQKKAVEEEVEEKGSVSQQGKGAEGGDVEPTMTEQ